MTEADGLQKKKRGRPAKEHRPTFSFRLSNATRARLQDMADQSGLSLSEEIERRLEKSFDDADLARRLDLSASHNGALARQVHECATLIEAVTGASWTTDDASRRALLAAISALISPDVPPALARPLSPTTRAIAEALSGAGEPEPETVGSAAAQVILQQGGLFGLGAKTKSRNS